MNPCCEGECFAKAVGFAKDGKFDKETAVKALNTAFSAFPEWQPVSFSEIQLNFCNKFDWN